MSKSSKITYLKHSSILFLPMLGTFLYKFQGYLYEKQMIGTVYMSREKNKVKQKLFRKISLKSKLVVCHSYKFARSLSNIEATIISDFKAPSNLKKLPLEKLHEIAWTFILSDKVTERTKISFGDFIPENFPTGKIETI